MDFAYTDEQRALQERAAALAAEIMVHEEACEAANGLPPDVHAAVAERVRAHGLQAIALRACDDAQRERYLLPGIRGERRDCVAVTERDAGSDPSAIATTARRVDGGFAIDGEKWFVTVGDAADYMIVLALVLPERAPTLFLIDKATPGVVVQRTPRYMHTFVYEHPEFGFTDVRVGEDAVLGGIGQGYELTRDWFVEERLMIGARAIGAAERALRTATEWAAGRGGGGWCRAGRRAAGCRRAHRRGRGSRRRPGRRSSASGWCGSRPA